MRNDWAASNVCVCAPRCSFSSTGGAAARMIFQTWHADIIWIDCVLRLRAAANYIAEEEIPRRGDRMKRKCTLPVT
jgi:hypothetical protein